MTQTATPPTIYDLQRRITYLEEVNEAQKKIINDLRWHDEIMSNTDLPIAARFAARAVRKFTQTRKPCDDGYYKGYLPEMEKLAGVSASTISRGIEQLSSATDAIDKYTDEIRDERGRLEKNLLYFRKNDTFEVATDITPTKELPKHGGNRRLPCPECGCVHRRVKRREECADCGHQFFENERIIRGDEESLQDETTLEDEENHPISVSAEIEVQNLNGHVNVFSLEEIDQAAEYARSLQDETGEPEASDEPLQLATLPIDTRVSSCNVLPLAELWALPIWACHREKEPYIAELYRWPQHAKSNDPSTWRTGEQAQAIYAQSLQEGWKYPYSGIGFMCTGDFTVIDYDHCIDENGNMSDQAQSWIDSIDSYAELSPSCTGVHQIARGTIPRNIKQPGCEMYDHLRFVTFTGQHLPIAPTTIENRQEQLAVLFAAIAPVSPLPKEAPRADTVYTPACPLDDDEVLKKARGASNGTKFTLLWEGKWEEVLNDKGQKRYGSQSEADQALCCMLAFSTGRDFDAMDRLFRQSGLYRPKWDRNVGAGETYGERAIRKALEVLA